MRKRIVMMEVQCDDCNRKLSHGATFFHCGGFLSVGGASQPAFDICTRCLVRRIQSTISLWSIGSNKCPSCNGSGKTTELGTLDEIPCDCATSGLKAIISACEVKEEVIA